MLLSKVGGLAAKSFSSAASDSIEYLFSIQHRWPQSQGQSPAHRFFFMETPEPAFDQPAGDI
jgi:hypothetical protein